MVLLYQNCNEEAKNCNGELGFALWTSIEAISSSLTPAIGDHFIANAFQVYNNQQGNIHLICYCYINIRSIAMKGNAC